MVCDSALAGDILDALSVDIVGLDDLLGDVGVELVVVVNDSLLVQVITVDSGDVGLVERGAVVVLSHDGLEVRVVGLQEAELSWQLSLLSGVEGWSNWWWSIAARVDWWQNWENL